MQHPEVHKIKGVAVAFLVILASGACRTEDRALFPREDLPELVLQPSEVPEPFALDEERSGYVVRGLPSGRPVTPTPGPFEPGGPYVYRQFFTQPEMVGRRVIPEGTSQFLSHAEWHEDEEGAAEGFRDQAGPGRPPGFLGMPSLSVPDLGDEAVRLELLPGPEAPFRSDFLVWRRSNLVLPILSVAVPVSDILLLARTLDERLANREDADPRNNGDDREVVVEGETAGAPWRLVTFSGKRGETCLATQDVENEFAMCNVSLERRPGARHGFIDWSYGNITGAEATLIAGLAAPQVDDVSMVLRDGRTLQARILDKGYPLQFFVKAIPEVVEVRSFIARDEDGEILERTPR